MTMIAGIDVAPGSVGTGRLRLLELVDGSTVEAPIRIFRGTEDGPTLYVGGGIHGDEIGGTLAVQQVIQRLKPGDLRGAVVCVPIQNPLAMRHQHRLPLGLVVKSPLDQGVTDMWASFPGDPDGNSAEVMAWRLNNEVLAHVDAVIDIHTPTTGGRYVPFVFLPPPTTGDAFTKTRRLAQAFAPDFILNATDGVYVQEPALHTATARRGIPAFGAESGEGGRVDGALIDRAARGVFGVMRALGIVNGEADEPVSSCRTIREMTAVRCRRGGFMTLERSLGDDVAAGDLVATVRDGFGDVIDEMHAPHDGPFMRATTFPVVTEGERVAQIGIEV